MDWNYDERFIKEIVEMGSKWSKIVFILIFPPTGAFPLPPLEWTSFVLKHHSASPAPPIENIFLRHCQWWLYEGDYCK